MAYDWSGGRVRRFRKLKIGAAFCALFLAIFVAQLIYGHTV
ncbi:hypothetical protein [Agrobacterium larrymoorei]|nr:hypothetical protein [Agrobacterium larrymoorei]